MKIALIGPLRGSNLSQPKCSNWMPQAVSTGRTNHLLEAGRQQFIRIVVKGNISARNEEHLA